jgi:hypothetical protein
MSGFEVDPRSDNRDRARHGPIPGGSEGDPIPAAAQDESSTHAGLAESQFSWRSA